MTELKPEKGEGGSNLFSTNSGGDPSPSKGQTMKLKPTGPDAVWQTHADMAAEKGVFDCQQCHGEPVSAVLNFEDGDTWVGEACYRAWNDKENPDRVVDA